MVGMSPRLAALYAALRLRPSVARFGDVVNERTVRLSKICGFGHHGSEFGGSPNYKRGCTMVNLFLDSHQTFGLSVLAMPSLTSLLPRISAPLGLTSAALYERQRALIRIGLLPSPQGRGKGSGAKANPDTVALLIISRLFTDNLSDANDAVRKLANAPFADRRRKACKWTGARIFRDAVSALLKDKSPWCDPGNLAQHYGLAKQAKRRHFDSSINRKHQFLRRRRAIA